MPHYWKLTDMNCTVCILCIIIELNCVARYLNFPYYIDFHKHIQSNIKARKNTTFIKAKPGKTCDFILKREVQGCSLPFRSLTKNYAMKRFQNNIKKSFRAANASAMSLVLQM